MSKWATFTSFPSGGHNIAAVDTYPEVEAIIRQTIGDGGGDLVFDSVEGAMQKILSLSIGGNTGFEFKDGTWMTVQRVGVNPPDINQVTKYLFLARDEIIDCLDDVNDYLVDASDQMMDHSVIKRLENASKLLEDLRQALSIPDRDYVAE